MKNNLLIKGFFALLCIFISTNQLFAQFLPKGLTTEEKLIMKDYYFNNQNNTKGFNYPPASNVRSAAEWEEIDGLIITWTSYTSVLTQIVKKSVNECKVYIVCSDSNSVKGILNNSGVYSNNIKYVIAPYNSVWVRDYAANNVYTNEVDSLLLVDWTYNRPRPKDDTLARTMAKITGLPLYEMNQTPNKYVATGGNYMSDGLGNAFSSKLILDENAPNGGYNQNLTENDIDSLTKKYLGIKRYIKFDNLPYDGIHHIDMHMKLLDEETILVGQYPMGAADGPQIEANLQYLLANHNSVFGTPYKVVRIPMPPQASNGSYPPNGDYLTYTNGVFVNKTFLYPTYYTQYDTIAQRIYEKALPGYNVIGINCNSTIPASGAIHCITHCIASKDPLLIVHQAFADTLSNAVPAFPEVKAYVKHRSGIQNVFLHYASFNNPNFDSIPMSPVAGQANYYSAIFPVPVVKSATNLDYKYYISAKSVSGKTQNRPITAPSGYWSFVYKMEVGINENNKISNLITLGNIYPNPASAISCIPVECNYNTEIKISLHDMFGKEIYQVFNGEIQNGKKNFFINAADFAKGIYFIKLQSKNDIKIQKLIIK